LLLDNTADCCTSLYFTDLLTFSLILTLVLRVVCTLCRYANVSGASVRRDRNSGVPGSTNGRYSTGTDAVDTDSRVRQRDPARQRRRPGFSAAADVRSTATTTSCPAASFRAGHGVPGHPCCLPAHHLLVPESTSVAGDHPVLRPDNAADDRADEGPAAEHSDPRCPLHSGWSCRGMNTEV